MGSLLTCTSIITMNVKPYEKYSVRSPKMWKLAADKMGVHPVILRKLYVDRYCAPIAARDFIDLILKNKRNRDDQKFADRLVEELAEIKMTPEEIAAKEASSQEAAEAMDFCDELSYRLKQLIQVGDEIVSDENKDFCFSKKQYQTAGNRYKILNLLDNRDGLTDFTAITNADIKGQIWWNVHGVQSVWRDGKEIWNWWRDYHALFVEKNPNHPQEAELRENSERNAIRCAKGKKERD